MARFIFDVALCILLLTCVFCLTEPVLKESQAGIKGELGIVPKEFLTSFATNEAGVAVRNVSYDESNTKKETSRRLVWNRKIALKSGWNMVLSPAGDLYHRYIADPYSPSFSIMRMSFSKTEINEAGKSRWGLRLGTRFGLLRFHKDGDPNHGFQLDIEAGCIGQFDIDNNWDNIGWDGIYGIQLAWAPFGGFAFRFGTLHDSSHVGDEYAERTGRERINYTREDWILGGSWYFTKKWRIYAEVGYARELRNEDLMDPLRVLYGLEYVSSDSFWKGRLGWYAAANVSSYEENDWNLNNTIQVGLIFSAKDLSRNYRLGIEYYNGRSHFGEFFQDYEKYLAVGFWFNL